MSLHRCKKKRRNSYSIQVLISRQKRVDGAMAGQAKAEMPNKEVIMCLFLLARNGMFFVITTLPQGRHDTAEFTEHSSLSESVKFCEYVLREGVCETFFAVWRG